MSLWLFFFHYIYLKEQYLISYMVHLGQRHFCAIAPAHVLSNLNYIFGKSFNFSIHCMKSEAV